MGQLSESDNERLLAHPLPTLRWALYDTINKSDVPVAICAERAVALLLNSEHYGGTCELREIKLFSDRMPVADPPPARWRSDT